MLFKTWLLGFEFPSTLFLFGKDGVTILTSASKGESILPVSMPHVLSFDYVAKILSQLQAANPPVAIKILAMAKAKEPQTDALPNFAEAYGRLKRVGIIQKDNPSGKLIDDWNKAISGLESKPELLDMSPAISAILAVKDEDELVSRVPNMPKGHSAHFLLLEKHTGGM